MAKQFFKNLPDNSTPLTATRLNGLLDGEESMGNLVVESIKSKNAFNPSTVFNGYINTSNNTIEFETSGDRYSGFAKVSPNTTYTISKVAGYSFRVATTTNAPTNGVAINQTTANHTGTSITITTGANDNYLVVFFYSSSNGDTGGYNAMANTIQVEIGSTATTYSPYQNLDGQEIYSTSEVKIGMWTDGKPLYRKVFTITSLTSSNTNLVDVSGLSIDFAKISGTIITSTGAKFPINLYDSATNYSVIILSDSGYIRGRGAIGSGTLTKCIVILEYTKTTD